MNKRVKLSFLISQRNVSRIIRKFRRKSKTVFYSFYINSGTRLTASNYIDNIGGEGEHYLETKLEVSVSVSIDIRERRTHLCLSVTELPTVRGDTITDYYKN